MALLHKCSNGDVKLVAESSCWWLAANDGPDARRPAYVYNDAAVSIAGSHRLLQHDNAFARCMRRMLSRLRISG